MLIYKKGNALKQNFNQNTILVHGCNNCYPTGVMGAGIAGAIRQEYPSVTEEYENWSKDNYQPSYAVWTSLPRLRLGEVQVVKVSGSFANNDAFSICNLISQQETGNNEWGMPPVRYDSIKEGLFKLGRFISRLTLKYPATQVVSVPLGCGLGGGTWDVVKRLFEECLIDEYDISVTIFDFKANYWKEEEFS